MSTALPGVDRRQFLLGATAAATTAVGLSAPAAAGGGEEDEPLFDPDPRRFRTAYERRVEAARGILDDDLQKTGNYARLDGRVGTYSKGLDHDDDGIVTDESFTSLETAFEDGSFEEVILGGSRRLSTPQTALSYDSLGADAFGVPCDDPPAFESDAAGASMVELYWRALARDVPCGAYGDDDTIAAASDELAGLDAFAGPTDPDVLFRGEYDGARRGPYVSQFLYRSADYGAVEVTPTVLPFETGRNYITSFEEWLGISRNGNIEPPEPTFEDERRYITTGRDLFRFVYQNLPGYAFFHAGVVAATEELPRDEGDPFLDSAVQAGFVDIDFPATILRPVQDIAHQVLRPAWNRKWLAYRYARPEEYGGILELVRSDRKPEYADVVPELLLDSEAVERTVDVQDTALLSIASPGGSPTHPAHPAGHASIAGACGTVLKALLDEDATFDDPQRPAADGHLEAADVDSLRVGDELNKLMLNNALGRDFGGYHYRFNGTAGIKLGEAYAISYLEDFISEFAPEPLGPLSLTTVDGEEIELTPSVESSDD